MRQKPQLVRVLGLVTVGVVAASLAWSGCGQPDQLSESVGPVTTQLERSRGPHEPVPTLDFGLSKRTLALLLDFEPNDVVKLRNAIMGRGTARGRRGEPSLLKFQLQTTTGALIEEFNMWDPRWQFYSENGRERRHVRTHATARFWLPYTIDLAQIDLYDVRRNKLLFHSALADLTFDSWAPAAPPPEILVGQPVAITLEGIVGSKGPTTPINALLKSKATADAGATVTPAETSTEIAGLAIGEARKVTQTFTVECNTPGAHTFVVHSEIVPKAPNDIDFAPANSRRETTVTLDCLVPVKINIKPQSATNPVNLRSANVPLAVLSTQPGEYGLPMAFDATKIDPLSVHFGPEALVWTNAGGGTELHARQHIEDSYEFDEVTRDGDLDTILHFNPVASGISATDTKACIKGEYVASGDQRFKFFGCDTIHIVP